MRAQDGQMDLLGWRAPQPVASFRPSTVQASSIAGRLSRAIAIALKECGRDRDDVAGRMTAYLGKPVSKNMIDAYASQAREDHAISAERLAALLHATGDRRLLNLIAEPFDWAVVERRYLPLIELAAVQDRMAELERQAGALKRQARRGGVL